MASLEKAGPSIGQRRRKTGSGRSLKVDASDDMHTGLTGTMGHLEHPFCCEVWRAKIREIVRHREIERERETKTTRVRERKRAIKKLDIVVESLKLD